MALPKTAYAALLWTVDGLGDSLLNLFRCAGKSILKSRLQLHNMIPRPLDS
jgi:hypothetical protein